jgi:hypothetical protein
VPPRVNVKFDPEQTVAGERVAVITGFEFTTTSVVPAALVQPPTVAVTEYVPALAGAGSGIEGFCNVELNPFGPVQLYVAPAIVDAVRSRLVDPNPFEL